MIGHCSLFILFVPLTENLFLNREFISADLQLVKDSVIIICYVFCGLVAGTEGKRFGLKRASTTTFIFRNAYKRGQVYRPPQTPFTINPATATTFKLISVSWSYDSCSAGTWETQDSAVLF